MVKYLVEHGANVNCKTKHNKSVLHFATDSGSFENVKYLVEHGADLHCKTKDNESVLHYAAKSDSLEIVKYLVEHGAIVNCTTKCNTSVLYYAAESRSLKMVKYLVEQGADINIGNETIVDYLFNCGMMKHIYDDWDHSKRSLLSVGCYIGNSALVQTLLKYKVDVSKEKELVCANEEIVKILTLELRKSIKYKDKIVSLKSLDEENLKKEI